MESLWPWLVVAATGAVHGLNPVTAWILTACSKRTGGRTRMLGGMVPIALGHVVALAATAAALPAALQLRLAIGHPAPVGLVAGLLLALAVRRLLGRVPRPAGQAGLALWSFIMGTAHGAGLMLVPALAPLCGAHVPALATTAFGPLLLALAAAGVHMTGMLAMTAAMAAGAQRGWDVARLWLKRRG